MSQTQYVDNTTNEIKEYKYSHSKSIDNFKRDFKNIPRLIKGFFIGDSTEMFITLSYSSKMEDPYRLSYDFKKFMQKLIIYAKEIIRHISAAINKPIINIQSSTKYMYCIIISKIKQ